MTFRTVAVTALGAVVFACAAPSARAGSADRTLRVFDVRQILFPYESREGPRFSLTERGPALREERLPVVPRFQEEGSGAAIDEDALLSMIRDLDPATSWEEAGTFLRVIHGRLFARHAPDALESIEGFLGLLEKNVSRTLAVRALIYRPGTGANLPESPLSKADADALSARIEREGRRIETVSALGLHGKRFHAAKGRQFLHLAEYDASVSAKAALADPVMEVADQGVVLDVHPVLSASTRTCILTLRLSCAFPDSGGAGVREAETPSGKVQVPSHAHTALRGSVTVPLSGGVVIGATSAEETGKGTSSSLRVLLRVDPVGWEPPEEKREGE